METVNLFSQICQWSTYLKLVDHFEACRSVIFYSNSMISSTIFLETFFGFVDFPRKSCSPSSIMTHGHTSTLIGFFLLLLTTLDLFVSPITASSFDHRYNVGDTVPLFVNIVGPLNNPRLVIAVFKISLYSDWEMLYVESMLVYFRA